MKTFTQFLEDTWGGHPQDQQLIASISSKAEALKQDLLVFHGKLTHGDEAVKHALNHFERSLETLKRTFETSVRKNTSNPERGDHPPVSNF